MFYRCSSVLYASRAKVRSQHHILAGNRAAAPGQLREGITIQYRHITASNIAFQQAELDLVRDKVQPQQQNSAMVLRATR